MFVDEAKVYVRAGRGGDGMVAFRREKYVPRGGPAGGDGGRGGDVIVVAKNGLNTLAEYRFRRHVNAPNGKPGGPKNMSGKSGDALYMEVPVGTLIYNDETGELLADLTEENQEVVIAEGGKGGLGNQHFVSSRNRAPRKATPGKEGDELTLRMELKLLADVGLVGFPSVGKSTLIAAVSNARPKIAAYPFTTLEPNLGVVGWRDFKEYIIADIPGLIPGAHEGLGLGIQFLKHVERCQVLLHVIEVTPQLDDHPDDRDPIGDYHTLCDELSQFNTDLLDRPQMVVLNKIDLPYVQEQEPALRAYFEGELGMTFMTISAASHTGLDELKDYLGELVYTHRAVEEGEQETASTELEWWEK